MLHDGHCWEIRVAAAAVVTLAMLGASLGFRIVNMNRALLTWHANAPEAAPLVDACAVVHAGVGLALVYVDLAPGPGEAGLAVAPKRSRGVDADAVVFARRS